MSIKKQLKQLKENWLIILIVILLLIFMNLNNMSGSTSYYAEDSVAGNFMSRSKSLGISPSFDGDFAPEVDERKITKTATLSNEVERGMFDEKVKDLKNIVSASNSLILNENERKNGEGRSEYKSASYTIKVGETKYNSVISQLKQIGEVKSFNEGASDITGQFENVEINLEIEKERLVRYEEMYAKATEVEDQITLNDRIFYQERTIKYLEDSLSNLDKKVEYSTIYFNLVEERSNYANVQFAKFSSLIRDLVESANSLLSFIFMALPWIIVGLIAKLIWKLKRN